MDFKGPHFASWNGLPRLAGVSLWGSPTVADVAGLDLFLRSLELGHSALIDLSLVDTTDSETFEALARLAQKHRERLREHVLQVALVRGAGIVGSIAAGLIEATRAPLPLQIFAALEPAAEWLGVPAGWAQRVRSERDLLAGANPLLAQLRDLFRQLGPRPITSAEVARLLAVSQRTLVRRLSELGTSFHRELIRCRIDTAQKLMRETDAPLGAIALEAGFSTAQRFSIAFRNATGQTPASWREKLPETRPVA